MRLFISFFITSLSLLLALQSASCFSWKAGRTYSAARLNSRSALSTSLRMFMDDLSNTNSYGENVKKDPTSIDISSTYDKFQTIMSSKTMALVSAFVASGALLMPQEAFAKGGEYGIFEGRTASMLHPVTMLLLFATSVYSGSLGLKWRQLRALGEEVKELNKQMPVLSSGKASSPTSEIISKINAELAILAGSEDNETPLRVATLEKDLTLVKSVSAVDSKIVELSAQRKQLQGQNLKGKHELTGSVLLGVGVSVSILGAFNTYMRAGKLFPGPHLYAGMAITMLWAAAAALVPEMQKGNEAARAGHIAFNSINVALFAWQVYTGLDIMFKVWGFTSWP